MLIVKVSVTSEILQPNAENTPSIDRAQSDLQEHSGYCNDPPISSHKFLLSQGHYYAAVFGNCIVSCPVDVQVRHDRFRRSMSQPLRE